MPRQAWALSSGLGRRGSLDRDDHLAARAAGGLDRRPYHDLAAFGARYGAADQQQVTRCIDTHDPQVLDGAAHDAHVAGHALAWKYPPGRLALADRTRSAVRQGHAVRGMVAGEVVALHDAGIALADRDTRDVDDLALGKPIDLELAARFQVGAVVAVDAKFDQPATRLDLGFGEVPSRSFSQKLGPAGTVSHLHRSIAVGIDGFHLRDAIGQHLDHGNGD